MSKKIKVNRTLDCLGLFCPEPVYRTRIELDKMKKGEVLEIRTDDPAAKEDIKTLTRHLGHEILMLKKEGDGLRFLVRKGE